MKAKHQPERPGIPPSRRAAERQRQCEHAELREHVADQRALRSRDQRGAGPAQWRGRPTAAFRSNPWITEKKTGVRKMPNNVTPACR